MSVAGLLVVTGMAFEARIAAGAGIEVLYGSGAVLERALARRLGAPCEGVISFGVAGGLDPSLAPGALIVAQRIAWDGAACETDQVWRAALCAALPWAVGGTLAGTDAAVASMAEKLAWRHATGAAAVDMESHLAARLAQAANVPFAACRIVLDPAQRALPSAALAALGSDGRTRLGPLLRTLAMQPQQLPGLLQLAWDAARARAVLRDTRAHLGERYGLPPTVPA